MTKDVVKVQRSCLQARWVLRDAPVDQVEKMMRAHDLPEIVARLLCVRGIDIDDVPTFLNPTLRDHFPDPFSLCDMRSCAEEIVQKTQSGCNVAIFADFDVDGATSCAILYRFLKAVGVDARIYIPERLSEGYGPNAGALKILRDEGIDLVLMLDCGSTSFEVIQGGRDIGLDIVVIDHHETEESLPSANYVINPKRLDDTSELDVLAACGVTFLLCVAVNSVLREIGFYKEKGISEPALKDMMDLLALGTVCDMVPLTGVNRLFVRHGFASMHNTSNIGLMALIEVSGITGKISPYHAGFVLGPRINAGSRVYKSDLGAKLLSTDDVGLAKDISWTLEDCNDKRKTLQAQMEHEALQQIEVQGLDQNPVIIVDGQGWHTGLSGLVAGRIKDQYQKPACVIAYVDGEGGVQGRGSGRSIPGVHIAKAFIEARVQGLLEKGGGHAMAGGFTVLPNSLDDFRVFMNAHIAEQMQSSDTNVEIGVEVLTSVQGLRPDFVRMISDSVGPFGQGYEEPLFLLESVRVHSVDIVGDAHIRAMIGDWEGGTRMKAMAFRCVGTVLGDMLLNIGVRPLHVIGRLKIDDWGGREKVEMHIKDIAPADKIQQKQAMEG